MNRNRGVMEKNKGKINKLESPVTLFAAIEQRQHEALRTLAFDRRQSIADLVREALDEYLSRHRVEKHYTKTHARAR